MCKRFIPSALLCVALFTVSCKRDLKSHPLAPGEREQIAHQIPDRDLSLNPPNTSNIVLLRSRIHVSAIICKRHHRDPAATEPHLPSSLKIISR